MALITLLILLAFKNMKGKKKFKGKKQIASHLFETRFTKPELQYSPVCWAVAEILLTVLPSTSNKAPILF